MYLAKILAPKNGSVKMSKIYFCREIFLTFFHCDIWNPLAEKVGNWRRGNCHQKWARWRERSSALTFKWKWNHLYGKSLNHLSPNEMNTFLIATKLKALTDEKSNCPSFKYLTRSNLLLRMYAQLKLLFANGIFWLRTVCTMVTMCAQCR